MTTPQIDPAAPEAVPSGAAGFYVTMKRDMGTRCERTAYLLGPYETREAAEADVRASKPLARRVDPWSSFDAFGVTRVTMQPGASLPPGKLNHLRDEEGTQRS